MVEFNRAVYAVHLARWTIYPATYVRRYFCPGQKKIQNPQPSETEQWTLISSSRRSHENETRNSQSRLVSRNLKQGPCLDSWPSTGAEKQTYFGSKLEGRFFWFDYPQSTCRQEGRSTELKIFSCFNYEARILGRHIVPIWQRPGQVPYKNLKISTS